MPDGYDPRKSKVSDSTMNAWRTGAVQRDLRTVPGIGPKAVEKLAEGEYDERITNTYQLFGKFLMLKGPDSEEEPMDSVEHTEKFWQYLKNKGITSHRSAIVLAIAEKASTFFPGVYDADMYEDDEVEED